jgi:pimeloyl-ACP methyl ester carboxylesterase
MTNVTHQFERKEVLLTKGPLTYFCAGTGKDVLYFHAAGGLQIRAVPERLRENCRVWIPVVPGYEATPAIDQVRSVPAVADFVAEFIDAMIGRPVDAIGHSLGSRLAAWLTLRHPEKVDRLILMAPAGFRPLDAPPLQFDAETTFRQMYAHPERRPAETRSPDVLAANRDAMKHYGISSSWDADLNERISEIQKRTLLLHGDQDVRVLVDSVRMINSKIKGSRFVPVDDAAHSLETDQPERVADLVEEFLLSKAAQAVRP